MPVHIQYYYRCGDTVASAFKSCAMNSTCVFITRSLLHFNEIFLILRTNILALFDFSSLLYEFNYVVFFDDEWTIMFDVIVINTKTHVVVRDRLGSNPEPLAAKLYYFKFKLP